MTNMEHLKSENREGLNAARRWAACHIGDAAWADDILRAYFNPETAKEELSREKE